MKNKLKQNSGFTLAELMLTMIILALTFVMIISGTTAAMNAYKKVTIKAESETLISTAITAISDDFKSASDIKNDGTRWVFNSGNRGYNMYYDNDTTQGIMIKNDVNSSAIPLLTSKTNSSNLYTTITYEYDQTNAYFKATVKTMMDSAVYDTQDIIIRPISSGGK